MNLLRVSNLGGVRVSVFPRFESQEQSKNKNIDLVPFLGF